MLRSLDNIGRRYPERQTTIDAERALAYADATNDHNPAYQAGKYAPPVFGVVPTWDSMVEVITDWVPPESLPMLVHASHDMRFHQPLVPGQGLRTTAEPFSVRTGGSGTRFTVRLVSVDVDSEAVLEQFGTVFVRGLRAEGNAGPERPSHSFPASARGNPVGQVVMHVDDDQTYRYRDASGDEMPIHVDDAAARHAGLPGIILHGLCTMAMCGRAVVCAVAGDDPGLLRRLAVRFSRPVFPGHDLVTSVFAAGAADGRQRYAFEALSQEVTVVKDGLAEVDDAIPGRGN